jgi:pimeloyl-ACP methyl ester carboxylesterase
MNGDGVGFRDDDLKMFEANGAARLPVALSETYIQHEGAQIWHSIFGAGAPVILLHGGLGHSGNWGYQVPTLLRAGYQVILVDGRGHGRSTRDDRPFRYELMASDVLAVMNALHLEKVSLVGWSDGAVIALMVAEKNPHRVTGVFFFACNMDPSGAKEMKELDQVTERCFRRHTKDYARLSETPERFDDFTKAVALMMKAQPNYTARDLASIEVPVVIAQGEHDEFIKPEHARYLAKSIPNAELRFLEGVTHFAPLQRPDLFSSVILEFLDRVRV